MSSNDQAIERLNAALQLFARSIAPALARTDEYFDDAIERAAAALSSITQADGHVQQAVGMTNINARLVALTSQLEEVVDHASAAQAATMGAADLATRAAQAIYDKIESLIHHGG